MARGAGGAPKRTMGFASLARIWKEFAGRHKARFTLGLLALVVASALYAFEIYMVRFIFDGLLNPSKNSSLSTFQHYMQRLRLDLLFPINQERLFLYIPITLVLIFFFKGIFSYLGKYSVDSVGLSTITDLRDALYKRIMTQSHDFFADHPTGMLISRLISDIEWIKTSVSEKLTELTNAILSLVALVISAFVQDWRLTLLSMVTIPMVAFPLTRFSRKLRGTSRRSQEQMALLSTRMKETISGIRIVQMFQMEQQEMERFSKSNRELLRANLKATRVMALTTPLMELIGGCAVAGILYYGHFRILSGHTTMGAFSAFLATLYAMYVPVKKLSQSNNIVQQAVSAAERSVELLDRPVAVVERPGAGELPPFSDRVRFHDVVFAYNDDEHRILDELNLDIPKGQILAIVGSSGAGKTTLVNLLPRLFDVKAGQVSIDGADIRDVTLRSLRSQIGMVSQETVLFDDSVAANIGYGNPAASQEAIERAARQALAHDFIAEMPQGYQTRIGEGGFALSGGQRQRLAIARALLKDPPILILDEATSNLDSESEYFVQQALFNLLKGRTTLVIAHRLATILNAHRIVVLDGGRVVEEGTHQELLDRGGLYAQLCEREFRASRPLEDPMAR
ncbi:MAG: ABC transporter ATP-binding protein [Acidobacteriota bacterium]